MGLVKTNELIGACRSGFFTVEVRDLENILSVENQQSKILKTVGLVFLSAESTCCTLHILSQCHCDDSCTNWVL